MTSLKKDENHLLRTLDRQFEMLKSKYYDCATSMEKQEIRNEVAALLSQVEGLGVSGRQLSSRIKAFLEMSAKSAKSANPPDNRGRNSLADLINSREQKNIIVQHPARRKD